MRETMITMMVHLLLITCHKLKKKEQCTSFVLARADELNWNEEDENGLIRAFLPSYRPS